MLAGTPLSARSRTGADPLLTVTLTAAEVAWFPAASKARAVSECAPFVDVTQEAEYGAAVSEDKSAPSTRKSTRVTPTLSDADALIVTVPLTVAPAAGEVTDAVGGVASGGGAAP